MSILGLGTDIVAVARMRDLLGRHGERFLERCFVQQEQASLRLRSPAALPTSVAGRWAAKEAFLKALGGSISHIPYQNISVMHETGGAPYLQVTGEAGEALQALGGQHLHLSISHEREFAVATVLIED